MVKWRNGKEAEGERVTLLLVVLFLLAFPSFPRVLFADTREEGLVEEHVTFSAGEITLEGLFSTPAQPPLVGVVVCHPHPLYGA
jgi:hypothetical protein